jgi:hypothetical protein
MNCIYKNFEEKWIEKVKALCMEIPDPFYNFNVTYSQNYF